MNLDDLKRSGGFVSRVPTPATITWREPDGEGGFVPKDYRVHIVEPSYGDIETLALEGKGERRAVMVATVAACVRLGDNAEQRLTYEQAFELHPTLLLALYAAIEKAGVQPKKPAPSPARTKSGTSSSLPASGGAPLRKRKRR